MTVPNSPPLWVAGLDWRNPNLGILIVHLVWGVLCPRLDYDFRGKEFWIVWD